MKLYQENSLLVLILIFLFLLILFHCSPVISLEYEANEELVDRSQDQSSWDRMWQLSSRRSKRRRSETSLERNLQNIESEHFSEELQFETKKFNGGDADIPSPDVELDDSDSPSQLPLLPDLIDPSSLQLLPSLMTRSKQNALERQSLFLSLRHPNNKLQRRKKNKEKSQFFINKLIKYFEVLHLSPFATTYLKTLARRGDMMLILAFLLCIINLMILLSIYIFHNFILSKLLYWSCFLIGLDEFLARIYCPHDFSLKSIFIKIFCPEEDIMKSRPSSFSLIIETIVLIYNYWIICHFMNLFIWYLLDVIELLIPLKSMLLLGLNRGEDPNQKQTNIVHSLILINNLFFVPAFIEYLCRVAPYQLQYLIIFLNILLVTEYIGPFFRNQKV